MRNFKLLIEYDGTDFVGWQVQPRGRSVQGVIQAAFSSIVGHDVTLIGAGRTDAGVHARGQVAHAKLETHLDPHTMQKALNARLPEDVAVHDVEEVDAHFHARYSARERMYRYFITRRREAIDRRTAWCVRYSLDVSLLGRAAPVIIGTHDFSSFARVQDGEANRRCTVSSSLWFEADGRLVYEVRADRFLRGMVRALVGTMVNIGRGYTPLDAFREILEARDRRRAGMSAPPRGLFLEAVEY